MKDPKQQNQYHQVLKETLATMRSDDEDTDAPIRGKRAKRDKMRFRQS